MAFSDMSKLYDAIIVGGGPAGLTAALYLARARFRVLVIEKDRFGGQITITNEVVNYPGVLCASGAELTDNMRRQAESFGAEFLLAEVTKLDLAGDIKQVHTSKGELSCFAVLLATGASPRQVGFAGEQEFRGRGVAYCATCDGDFFTGKDVFVIGGGFAAAEESVFLTRYAKQVTVLMLEDDFICAEGTAEEARNNPKIKVLPNRQVVEVQGDTALRSLRYINTKTGEESVYRAPDGDSFGLFVFAGYVPSTQLVKGIADLDEQGYVITDANQMTSADGLFAAGDVCVKGLRQVATAVGEAAQTATNMERYLKAAQERTGLVPQVPKAPLASSRQKDPSPAQGVSQEASSTQEKRIISPEMAAQLDAVFSRMESPLKLVLALDERPVSHELKAYMDELVALSDKLTLHLAEGDERAAFGEAPKLPAVRVCDKQGNWTGLAFHGVPGGHEFTSFVLGLYNAAGPGQPIDDADRAAIAEIKEAIDVKVLVSLSCTMCPDTVLAAQRIASLNPQVTAEVYDVAHFPELRDAYHAMSVPCVVIAYADGQEKIVFGRKGTADMLAEIARPHSA